MSIDIQPGLRVGPALATLSRKSQVSHSRVVREGDALHLVYDGHLVRRVFRLNRELRREWQIRAYFVQSANKSPRRDSGLLEQTVAADGRPRTAARR